MHTHTPLRSVAAALLLALGSATGQSAVIAKYSAGTEGNPATAPDPTTPEGGNWTFRDTTGGDADFQVGPVSPDGTTGWNAWRTFDASTGPGRFVYYYVDLTDQQLADAAANGCRLRTRCRVEDPVADNGGSWSAYISFGSIDGRRWTAFFDIDAEGDLQVNLQGSGGAILKLTTNGVGATEYHVHELVYDPLSHTVSYYFDGELRRSNITGLAQTRNQVSWGTESSGGRGDGYWNEVTFEVMEPQLPEIIRHPVSSTNAVGDTITFTAEVSGTVTNLQWLHDGMPIPGANGASYTIDFVTVLDAGSYVLRVEGPAGAVESDPAVLTVLPDTTPPSVVRAVASVFASRIRLTFSEPVDPVTAGDFFNYAPASANFDITEVIQTNAFTVELRTTLLTPGSTYELLVSLVKDLAENEMPPDTLVSVTTPSEFPLTEQLLLALDGTSAKPTPPDGVMWEDLSGNDHHALPTTDEPGRRPTLKPDALNGRAAVHFLKSAQQWLRIDGAASVGFDGSAFTWFVVAKPTNFANFPNVIRHQSTFHGANWGSFFFAGNAGTGNQPGFVCNGRRGTGGAVEAIAFPVALNEWYVLTGYADGPNGEVFSRAENLTSGTVVSAVNNAGEPLVFGAPIGTWIGGTAINAGHSFDGDIAEVLVYSGVLDDTQRAQVETYLKQKYAPARPTLSISRDADGTIRVEFTGVLQTASEPQGPYTDLPDNPDSPVLITPENQSAQQFFRARTP